MNNTVENLVPMGPISWMVRHRVAPNLLMLLFIIGGLYTCYTIQKEFLPSRSASVVSIEVDYSGATPLEIEQGVVLPVENALQGMESIKNVETTINQGSTNLEIELRENSDRSLAYQDIKQAVDRITTFPKQIERPVVSLAEDVVEVLEVAIFGELDLFTMKRLGEQIRLLLLEDQRLSKIDMRGLPAEELHIDISPQTLKRYNLSLQDVAEVIANSSIEQSAGSVKTSNGQIMVSVNQRKFWAEEFGAIPVIQNTSGDTVLLQDIAKVSEGFADSNELVTFNGKNGVLLNVYRVEEQTPVDVYEGYLAKLPEIEALLPPGAGIALTDNDAKTYSQRLGLLLKNAFIGLLLVMITLALFLQHRLAFWVVMGIPTTFLGAILFLPYFDVSINIISLFGFIIALGIVVDDAIIAGENIYANQQRGMSFAEAAVVGSKELAVPLSFAVLTNAIAFLPLIGMPGDLGRLFGSAPIVVLLCFAISWVEALFILPAHLASESKPSKNPLVLQWVHLQQRFNGKLDRFIEHQYQPFLQWTLQHSLATVVIAFSFALVILSWALSGRMGFSIFPEIEGEWAVATAELPNDASFEQVKAVRNQIEQAALSAVARSGGEQLLVSRQAEIEGNTVEVGLYLTPTEIRPTTAHVLVNRWQQDLGEVHAARSIEFDAERGGGPGNASRIEIELRFNDGRMLAAAIADAEHYLQGVTGVSDIKTSFSDGIPQWDIRLNERGRSLGLNAASVAQQLRDALHGHRALRQQRQSSEVTVLVRFDDAHRNTEVDISRLPIQTPTGGHVLLSDIALLNKIMSPLEINRRGDQRVERISIRSENYRNVPILTEKIGRELFPLLMAKYPGIRIDFSGSQEDTADGLSALMTGTVFALLAIFAALAIALRSYTQPLIVMSIIPFAAVGAILGHLLLGYSLSVISLQGILALSGVVINSSLLMTDFANTARQSGLNSHAAISQAALKRFRPIALTTITTFFGLAPMVFETDRQAQMVIPMAVSLGFGILFTAMICLLVLPALYCLLAKMNEKKY